jgi:phage tail-like protein
MVGRNDPLRNFRFRVEIDGSAVAGFSEVILEPITTNVIEYREGSDPMWVRKLPGLTKFGNINLKRGLTVSRDLADWAKAVLTGNVARRKVSIIVLDEAGKDEARFLVSEAWPMKYQVSGLNAKGNEVLIEALELANEGIERVS